MARKTLLSWSTGKDSAWTLHVLRRDPEVEVAGLFLTVDRAGGRVAMHGTRLDVARAQAAAAGLPLLEIALPWPCPNEVHERAMRDLAAGARAEGVAAFAFGDLFLEDIRAYRRRVFEGTGVAPVFPLWGLDTGRLARAMVAGGLRAHVTVVDPGRLDAGFAGRVFDGRFLDDLPAGVDPCGERGEFHTCVFAGPIFARPVPLRLAGISIRDGFAHADMELAAGVAAAT